MRSRKKRKKSEPQRCQFCRRVVSVKDRIPHLLTHHPLSYTRTTYRI